MTIDAIYTAESTATGGGRDGNVASADGKLDLVARPPREMGGSGEGVNPELLFSAGYSLCFLGALRAVAKSADVRLDEATAITVRVGIGREGSGYRLGTEIVGYLPGLDQARAEDLMQQANQVCPYSKATRGNVEATLTVKV